MPRSLLRVTTAAACAALVSAGLTAPRAASADRSGPSNTRGTEQARCSDLDGLRIPANDIGLRTRGATITATNPQDSPASFCQVLGEIHPVDRSAPPIRFQVNLPRDWNRRTMLFGGGGYNGTIAAGVGQVPGHELVVRTLLPLAADGLADRGVDGSDVDRLLGIIERRCVLGRNGASWQVEEVAAREADGLDRRAALGSMLATYIDLMRSNTPVHEWPSSSQ